LAKIEQTARFCAILPKNGLGNYFSILHGSDRKWHTQCLKVAAMKNRIDTEIDYHREQLIASFGQAELVKIEDAIVLRGGTSSDRTDALEWISLFLPEEFATVEAACI
jgi:hypothetical protein